MNLDFGFLSGDVVSSFILKGLVFSVQLTLIAMVGGIALGTVLALMRLSGKKWLVLPASAYVTVLRSVTLEYNEQTRVLFGASLPHETDARDLVLESLDLKAERRGKVLLIAKHDIDHRGKPAIDLLGASFSPNRFPE